MSEPFTNRLVHEKSPYLQQHAHNPVDWYPWGQEAFLKAKDEDKPIFLSIGYSTCHWCHVMEKESFKDVAIAQLMNESFVNVKVDREELPDVDGLYMEFAQAIMPSGGGWPLNVVLTPELEPFFATTYVPKDAGRGYVGFKDLVVRLKDLWNNQEEKEKLLEQASKIVEVFEAQSIQKGFEIPLRDEISNAAELLFHMEDPVWGGIKGEPKFPMGYHSCFLLSYAKLRSESRALFCVELTLDMMLRGGIYDHLGGGFSRYCLDSKWRIPHFEKMLYDNAIISRAYLEAYQFTKKEAYKKVVEQVLEYVFNEMTSPLGAFYSAEDADSEGKEGYYYTWGFDEVKSLLKPADFKIFSDFYSLTKEGNFEGRNVLFVKHPLEKFIEKRQLDPIKTQEIINESKKILLKERSKRIKPFKDDKILTSWNGLMIYTLALASKVLNKSIYLKQARACVNFIKSHLFKENQLFRRWRDSEARFNAGLDEYAFLIHGLLELYQVEGNVDDLSFAVELTQILETEFKESDGAFYLGDGKDPYILLRRSEFYDGAEPSGNGIHCENLLKLYQITFDESYLFQAEDILRASKKHIEHHPAGCCYSLMALDRYWDKHAATLVIALNKAEELKSEIENILFDKYLPHHVIVWKYADVEDKVFEKIAPHIISLEPKEGKTTLYICQRGECKGAISSSSEITKVLQDL
jgi:uncharacterized protein YyaL (SSP411 family)